jgi:uncharacterized protein (DUF2252 family)
MVTAHVIDRITELNAGRTPDGIKAKYALMRTSPAAFFRGTAHLFYGDLPRTDLFQTSPPVWACGDLHWENFGSYKGEDRLVYFNINDFDEALLAPCTGDIARFLTSVMVGAETLKLDASQATQLGDDFLLAYRSALCRGKAQMVQRKSAVGLVSDLLKTLEKRDRAQFLDDRTRKSGQQLKLIPGKTAAIADPERERAIAMFDRWAQTQPEPEFYRVLDVVYRIAGNGSLGLERYLILVEGNGGADRRYLLDLKAARASALQSYSPFSQPTWISEADRIVQIQSRVQESAPAILHAIQPSTGKSYVLRELQPSADKIDLVKYGQFKPLRSVVQTMGRVTAWDHLRSGGRSGSAIADELMAFGARSASWQPDLLEYATAYAAQVKADYKTFCAEH